jgi:hypothetical protein
MMKHSVGIATGLASLLVLPAALGQQEVQRLNEALSEISHAIDVMTGIDQALQEEPGRGIDLVLSATETPHLEQRGLDDRLGSLRKEVSLLQMEVDALESPGARMTLQPFVPSGPAAGGGGRDSMVNPPVVTGLDDSLRAAISRREVGRVGRSGPLPLSGSGSGSGTFTNETPESPEHGGYTADPLGQAQACYRVGRYQQGLELLRELDDTTALYWKSRCLERLDRLDEALAFLTRVVAAEGESYEGRRAAKDLEFLKWKKAFLQKLPEGMQDARRDG